MGYFFFLNPCNSIAGISGIHKAFEILIATCVFPLVPLRVLGKTGCLVRKHSSILMSSLANEETEAQMSDVSPLNSQFS